MTPVLRFHDLFREFLETELARRDPELKRDPARARGRAERIDSRAIYHLLAAQRWDEAMTRIARRVRSDWPTAVSRRSNAGSIPFPEQVRDR